MPKPTFAVNGGWEFFQSINLAENKPVFWCRLVKKTLSTLESDASSWFLLLNESFHVWEKSKICLQRLFHFFIRKFALNRSSFDLLIHILKFYFGKSFISFRSISLFDSMEVFYFLRRLWSHVLKTRITVLQQGKSFYDLTDAQ